jgi:hypothetical protein
MLTAGSVAVVVAGGCVNKALYDHGRLISITADGVCIEGVKSHKQDCRPGRVLIQLTLPKVGDCVAVEHRPEEGDLIVTPWSGCT